MSKDETYYFHQTPEELCKKLIEQVPLIKGDRVLEPFKGEGNFYNNLPDFVEKDWAEITEGKDYKDYTKPFDWVLTNPPFKMDEEQTGKRVNTFYKLLKYYTQRAEKGIAFLGNDFCFSTLTPIRLKELNESGWYIHNIVCCSVKKWRGRYFFIIFKKELCNFYSYVDGSH
jgi:type I restriction-modification system DNA methylase subunit